MKKFSRGNFHSLALPGWVRGLCSQIQGLEQCPDREFPSQLIPALQCSQPGQDWGPPAVGTVLAVGTAAKGPQNQALGAGGFPFPGKRNKALAGESKPSRRN